MKNLNSSFLLQKSPFILLTEKAALSDGSAYSDQKSSYFETLKVMVKE